MAKKRRWGLIILGVIVFIIVVGIATVATVGFVMYRQFAPESRSATTTAAEKEFSEISARFPNEKPYIEIHDDKPVVNREKEKATPSNIEVLHVLVFNPDDERTFRINIPFWLVRLTSRRGTVNLGEGSRRRSLNVGARDIERHGPGLIFDFTDDDGERVMVWAQ